MIRINNTQYFHFLEQADALRRSGSLCDAVISVKSQTFQAHRLVLACASRRLAQLLARGDTDSPVHCTLEYFSPHTFQQVLDFTYTQTLEVSEEDLHLLLRAAQLLEMQLLQEQCWEQLDNLPCRDIKEEFSDVKEEESGEDPKPKGSPVGEKKLRKESLLMEEEGRSIITENSSPSDPTEHHNSHRSSIKKPKVSPVSYVRDSVIIRPDPSSSSFSPPWTFPANMWGSVSTLRHIAEYAAHPLQPQNQFTLFPPHLLPLLGSHFQSSVMGYSAFHPGYTQNLRPVSRGVGSIIKQGLLKRKKSNHRVLTGAIQPKQTSYHEEPKSTTERVKTCRHCSTSLNVGPASTASGVCQFCRKAKVLQCEPQSHRQEHRGEKPYQCQICPKKFSLKHQLDTHHRVHTGEKPFECLLCGQRSRDYSAMIKHLRTHGGAAPYRCTVCLEFCSSLVAMQRHVKGHPVQDFPPDWSINNTYLYTSHI
ncbi:zinc finger and BTB domain-containing protein 16-A [Notolabrus celidotus]|uniref:zinc finger and BTB domain-containing protein 16-A n=1 Tax=Notolabrus celidotus TaxID=1203425 RepID=UPI001490035B|nr:zinc finger and BTB domain-containing protein 16-A [Notolabrus celidotus]